MTTVHPEQLPEGAGPCAKQTVTALIIKDDDVWVGTNYCKTPQNECPRKGMKTGEGYDLCRDVCGQEHHAEVNACCTAGLENAQDATMVLFGHTYACKPCSEVCAAFGIKEIVFPATGERHALRS